VDALHPDGPGVSGQTGPRQHGAGSPADIAAGCLKPDPVEVSRLVQKPMPWSAMEMRNKPCGSASADCSPVLIGDRTSGRTAAIHAGWRGTAQGIVPVAIKKMVAQGSQLEDLVVAIGPAIAGEVYQVSVEVGAAVGRTVTSHPSKADHRLIDKLLEMPQSPLMPDPEPDRVRLDVRRTNLLQLKQLGLTRDQVAIAPHCTFQQPKDFFSYRRTGEKQVQWSGIVSQ
jgi:YfiH family protein